MLMNICAIMSKHPSGERLRFDRICKPMYPEAATSYQSHQNYQGNNVCCCTLFVVPQQQNAITIHVMIARRRGERHIRSGADMPIRASTRWNTVLAAR